MSLFNILVDIAANTASLESGLKRAEDQLEKFGDTVRTALEFAGVATTVAEVVEGFDHFIETASKTAESAQKIGIAVDQLSELQFAASQSGVSADALSSGLEKLAKNAALAASGSKQQAAAFAAIGVSVTDSAGNLKDLDDLLKEVADKFASYADGTAKTALAQEIFSRAGAELIPILNEGADGIEKLEAQSDALGNTLSGATAEAAKKFRDTLDQLHAVANGFWNLTAQQLLPTLQTVADQLVKDGTGANAFYKEIDPLVTGLKLLTDVGYSVYKTFTDVGSALGAIAAVAVSAAKGNFSEASDIWKQYNADAKKSEEDGNAFLAKLWSDTGGVINKIADSAADAGKKLQAPIVSTFDLADQLANTFLKIDETTRSQLASTADRISNENDRTAQNAASKSAQYGKHSWDELDQISQEGARNIQGAFQDFLFDPAAKGFSGLASDFLNAIRKMVAEAAANDIFKALFGSDKSGNSGLGGDILGGLGSLFGFASGGGASAGTSTGAAGGFDPFFANGGSFTVGGSSNTDSNLVQFMATRGERVQVTTPGQSAGGAPNLTYAPVTNISNGVTRAELLAAMNQTHKNAVGTITGLIRGGAFA